MKHEIFLLHGMGNHFGRDWHTSMVDSLRQAYSQFPNSRLARVAFDDRFHVTPITYDGIFQQLLARWAQDADELGPMADAMNNDAVRELLDEVVQSPDPEGNFVWSHATDVIMFRAFRLVRERVTSLVATTIAQRVAELPSGTRWSVVAHSLGTAVTQQSLQKLFSGFAGDESTGPFSPVNEQAHAVAMIANVSRVLQTQPKAYDSLVCPGDPGQAGRGCLHYVNAVHELDPFTLIKRFDPVDWPDSSGAGGRYSVRFADHFHRVNIHAFEHYIAHPSVHVALFRALTFPYAISDTDEEAAVEAFPTFSPEMLSEGRGIRIRQKLEDHAPALGAAWEKFPAIWDLYQDLQENG